MKKLSEKELNEILGGVHVLRREEVAKALPVAALRDVVMQMGHRELGKQLMRVDASTITAEAFCSMAAGLGMAVGVIEEVLAETIATMRIAR